MSTETMSEKKGVQTIDGELIGIENIATESRATTPSRTFYRHPTDKMVSGVCGGVADFLKIDSTLIRLFWVVMTLMTGGGGVLAYLALWLLLPVGTSATGQERGATISLSETNVIRTAYVLIALGALWLLSNIGILGNIWGIVWSMTSLFLWPALLIGAGYMLLRGSNRSMKVDFGAVRSKIHVNGKMPSADDVRAGLSDVKARFPLKRSRQDRMLMGVCGGIGRKLGIDANLVRLIWAAFSIGSIGLGVLVYVAVGLLLPEESEADLMRATMEPQNVNVVDSAATSVS